MVEPSTSYSLSYHTVIRQEVVTFTIQLSNMVKVRCCYEYHRVNKTANWPLFKNIDHPVKGGHFHLINETKIQMLVVNL